MQPYVGNGQGFNDMSWQYKTILHRTQDKKKKTKKKTKQKNKKKKKKKKKNEEGLQLKYYYGNLL